MTNMGDLLFTLNTRIDGFERRQDHMEGAAVPHTMYTAPQGASTSQDPEVQAPHSRLMTAETRAPLPDMADKVRAQVGGPAPMGSSHLLPPD